MRQSEDCNQEETLREAEKYLPIVQATTEEVISAHVKVARNLAKQMQKLRLGDAFGVYEKSPTRTTLAARVEELSYQTTFQEFVEFAGKETLLSDITPEFAEKYSNHLKTTGISVSTHNRKSARIRRIFAALKEYYQGPNPVANSLLQRKSSEEQGTTVRRLAFTQEQEETLREILDEPKFQIINKREIKVIYYWNVYRSASERLRPAAMAECGFRA